MQYEIEKLGEIDYDFIQKISDDLFGENYMDLGVLKNYPNSLVLKNTSEIIGFVLFKTFVQEEYQWSKNENMNNFFGRCNEIVLIKSIAVKKEYQNKGFGTILIKEILKTFPVFTGFVICAWKHNDTLNLLGILNKFKFTYLYRITHFWYEESLSKNYNCVICGSPPCVCSAEMYGFIKELV